jgi:hypothetical protein
VCQTKLMLINVGYIRVALQKYTTRPTRTTANATKYSQNGL